jgi:hypothetical protein
MYNGGKKKGVKNKPKIIWSRPRLLNLLASAKFSLFSTKGYEPNADDLKKWLNRYLKRETFKEYMKNGGKEKIREDTLLNLLNKNAISQIEFDKLTNKK